MEWSKEQLQAITVTDDNALVSASAGSGKTAVMVERVVRLLTGETEGLEEPVPVSRLLLLTFNNSVGAELREKVHEELLKRITPSNAEAIRAQLDALPLADISTMHSFCKRLISEHFDVLGIDPSFTLAEEDEGERLFAKAVTSVLDKANAEGDVGVFELREYLGGEERLRDEIKRLYSFTAAAADGKNKLQGEWLSQYRSPLDDSVYVKGFLRDIRTRAESLEEDAQSAAGQMRLNGLNRHADSLEDTCALMSKLKTVGKYADAHAAAGLKQDVSVRFTQKIKDEYDPDGRFETIYKDLRARAKSLLDDITLYFGDDAAAARKKQESSYTLLLTLTSLVSQVWEEYSALKREVNKLDFNDLESLACKLLSDKSVAEETASRYSYICVDEYQDINEVQEFILQAVSCGRKNLFMVGDSKQSIYAFRNADTEIFLSKYDKYERSEGGKTVRLNRNYRSDKGILEFVNSVFDCVMTRESGGIDYKRESRFICDDKADEGEVHVCVFAKEKSEKKPFDFTGGIYSVREDAGRVRDAGVKAEAVYIADCIHKLIAHGKVKRKDGTTEPFRYEDMVILSMSRSEEVAAIIRQLRELGIPVSSEGLVREDENLYVGRLTDYLRVIDNFRQDVPLATAMIHFGGFGYDDCARIRRSEDEYFWQSVLAAAERNDLIGRRVKAFCEETERYRFISGFTNVSDLARRIIADHDYDAQVQAREGGDKLLAELNAFVDSLAGKSYDASLSSFVWSLENGVKVKGSAEPTDCVRTMTMHSSKGLEFPVVFIVDAGHGFNREDSRKSVLYDRHYGIACDGVDSAERIKYPTLFKHYLRYVKYKETLQDRMRLMYVAMTRARNIMYITGTVNSFADKYKDNPSCLLDWIGNVCVNVPGFAEKYLCPPPDMDAGVSEEESKRILTLADGEDYSFLTHYLDAPYKYAECAGTGIKYSVSAINKEGAEEYVPFGGKALFGEENNTVGTAYHRVLSLIDYNTRGVEAVRAAIVQMTDAGLLSRIDASLVDAQTIADCLDSEIMDLARGCRHMREKKFTLYLPASQVIDGSNVDEKILLQGAIDLVIFGGDVGGSNVLVDFKYTKKPSEEVRKTYAKQLELYSLAVEECAGVKLDRRVLYILGRNETLEL